MINDLNKRWKQFILNEGTGPDIGVWMQSLKDNINMMRPRSIRESKRVELMKHQLAELLRDNLKTVRSYLLKEEFQGFWSCKSPCRAGESLDKWCTKTM